MAWAAANEPLVYHALAQPVPYTQRELCRRVLGEDHALNMAQLGWVLTRLRQAHHLRVVGVRQWPNVPHVEAGETGGYLMIAHPDVYIGTSPMREVVMDASDVSWRYVTFAEGAGPDRLQLTTRVAQGVVLYAGSNLRAAVSAASRSKGGSGGVYQLAESSRAYTPRGR